MYRIRIKKEVAAAFAKVIRNEFFLEMEILYTARKEVGVFLVAFIGRKYCGAAAMVAVMGSVEGDYSGENVSLRLGRIGFELAAESGKDVILEIEKERVTFKDETGKEYKNLDMSLYGGWIVERAFEPGVVSPLAKALLKQYPEIACFSLPTKIKKGWDAIFDFQKERVGKYKEIDVGVKRDSVDIKHLKVWRTSSAVVSYGGEVAMYMPWEKGVTAEILDFEPEKPILRWEMNPFICVQMPLRNSELRYSWVFGEKLLTEDAAVKGGE